MQTIKPVTLVRNRPIKFRKRRDKEVVNDSGDVLFVPKFTSDSDRLRWGGILDKNIQTYNMWFRFLKLALELQDQGATLIVKRNMKKGSTKANDVVRKIKVDERKYVGWDLEQVRTSPFRNWWKTHRHLFLDEGIQVLKPGEKVGDETGYIYVKINTRRRIRDINAALRKQIGEKTSKHESQSKFKVHGKPRPLQLQNRYNALILKLEGELTDKQIIDFKNKHLRAADKRLKNGYKTRYAVKEGSTDTHYGRIMFGLISGNERILGAKQILLNVCDGYFLSRPDEKKSKT
jgi:hypothetical protein